MLGTTRLGGPVLHADWRLPNSSDRRRSQPWGWLSPQLEFGAIGGTVVGLLASRWDQTPHNPPAEGGAHPNTRSARCLPEVCCSSFPPALSLQLSSDGERGPFATDMPRYTRFLSIQHTAAVQQQVLRGSGGCQGSSSHFPPQQSSV